MLIHSALRQVGDLISFQNFLRALAARTGRLLNLSDLSRDLGIALNTAKARLAVLEATSQVIVLRPYHANIGNRPVKRPKVYFTDTGTLRHLAGLNHPQHALAGRRLGSGLPLPVKHVPSKGNTPPMLHLMSSVFSQSRSIIGGLG
ncbi:MAG: DUF4143 domain-containing protein [Acidobacteria bacterium]|nr:DUF4143 domain-containing protein [Acidobacteriota bacterium]